MRFRTISIRSRPWAASPRTSRSGWWTFSAMSTATMCGCAGAAARRKFAFGILWTAASTNASRFRSPLNAAGCIKFMANLTPEQFQKEAYPFMDEIYASALRLARQKENAEDLVSEVYERAWKSYAQFTPGTNMRAWLYRILTNTFINHYRHKQREPKMVDLDQPSE